MRAADEPEAHGASSSGQAAEAADVLHGQADIVDALLAANRVFVAVAGSALAGLAPEVTLPQFRALVLLDQHATMTVAQLAHSLGVVPSTATRMCDRLVAKKLVRRATERSNRRRVSISLLPDGQRLITESTRRRRLEIDHLLAAVPTAEQQHLAAALRLLVAAAQR